ncbi:hypothetical protein [Methylotenera sp.]|uniref:hypothetical protein n=1 Tax=Methylotenera sp. TaxID=2051956 RepID=UPI002488EF67|nr:hypothetical protein [Methylotenera sp.]MDI1298071.1 hypothetical protein [Methylotenera sp.]
MDSLLKYTVANTTSTANLNNGNSQRSEIVKTGVRKVESGKTAWTMTSGDYTRTRDGCFMASSESEKEVAICSFIRYEANMRDNETGQVSVRVKFKDIRNQLTIVLVPRADFNYPSRLVDLLSNAGFWIGDMRRTKIFLIELYQLHPPKNTIGHL